MNEIENSIKIFEKLLMNIAILKRVAQEEVYDSAPKTEKLTDFLFLLHKHCGKLLEAIGGELERLKLEAMYAQSCVSERKGSERRQGGELLPPD